MVYTGSLHAAATDHKQNSTTDCRMLPVAAGNARAGGESPQASQQVFIQSPLYAGKQGDTAGGWTLSLIPNASEQIGTDTLPACSSPDARTDDALAVAVPDGRKQLVTETASAPPSSQYPDTPLYQFADIELAHHHHHTW